MADLFDWRNANGITFMRTDKGDVWVSPHQEHLLTDDIREAIHANQETLANFVPTTDDITLSVDGETFLAELGGSRNVPTVDEAIRQYVAERDTQRSTSA